MMQHFLVIIGAADMLLSASQQARLYACTHQLANMSVLSGAASCVHIQLHAVHAVCCVLTQSHLQTICPRLLQASFPPWRLVPSMHLPPSSKMVKWVLYLVPTLLHSGHTWATVTWCCRKLLLLLLTDQVRLHLYVCHYSCLYSHGLRGVSQLEDPLARCSRSGMHLYKP